MKISFLLPAESELDDAVAYYENRVSGLGRDFAREVQACLMRIDADPRLWRRFADGARRCRVQRFPYAIVYREHDASIIVIAIAHNKRRPGYWRDRLQNV